VPQRPENAELRSHIDWSGITYLNNESTTFQLDERVIKVYGSPWTPKHGNWAFQYPRSQNIWDQRVPDDVDILVTHGPPAGHLDNSSGCPFLLSEVWRTRPLLHVFGHINVGYGVEGLSYDGLQKAYENACLSRGGLARLVLVVFEFIKSCFRRDAPASCVMVNASTVGGIRDELRRPAIQVTI